MDLTARALLIAARDTVADPRGAARQVIGMDLPLQAAMTAVVLMAVGSTILAHVSFALLTPAMRAGLEGMMANPIGTALVQVIAAIAGVFAVYRLGRWRGGRGTLAQTAALLAWLQFVLLLVQVLQIAAEVVLPPFALILGYAGVALFFWLLVHFVMELHGFRSATATFFGILFFMFVVGFVIALMIAPAVPVPAGG
jgi:hypothetical protein